MHVMRTTLSDSLSSGGTSCRLRTPRAQLRVASEKPGKHAMHVSWPSTTRLPVRENWLAKISAAHATAQLLVEDIPESSVLGPPHHDSSYCSHLVPGG